MPGVINQGKRANDKEKEKKKEGVDYASTAFYQLR